MRPKSASILNSNLLGLREDCNGGDGHESNEDDLVHLVVQDAGEREVRTALGEGCSESVDGCFHVGLFVRLP